MRIDDQDRYGSREGKGRRPAKNLAGNKNGAYVLLCVCVCVCASLKPASRNGKKVAGWETVRLCDVDVWMWCCGVGACHWMQEIRYWRSCTTTTVKMQMRWSCIKIDKEGEKDQGIRGSRQSQGITRSQDHTIDLLSYRMIKPKKQCEAQSSQ